MVPAPSKVTFCPQVPVPKAPLQPALNSRVAPEATLKPVVFWVAPVNLSRPAEITVLPE